jgi:hypothetical protein
MDKKMFNELLESVKEMDAIAAGKKSQPGFLNIQIPRFVPFVRRPGFHRIGLLI